MWLNRFILLGFIFFSVVFQTINGQSICSEPFLISDGSTTDNRNAQISGDVVVWQGWDASGWQIYKNDGSGQTLVSTGTSTYNIKPQISGNTIVWQGEDGGVKQIYKNEGQGQVLVSTGNSISNCRPKIDGSTIIWQGSIEARGQYIFKNEGAGPILVSTNSSSNTEHNISGNTIVWRARTPRFNVYKNAGAGPILVSTDMSEINIEPRVDGNTIVWLAGPFLLPKLFKDVGFGPVQVSLGDDLAADHQVKGNTIVWVGFGTGGHSGIYKDDGRGAVLVSDGPAFSFSSPQIDGQNIVWQSYNALGQHIYLNDGVEQTTVSTEISSNNLNPQIDESTIVWEGLDNTTTKQIYRSTCRPLVIETIPTMGEWGLIILGLCFIIINTLSFKKEYSTQIEAA